MTLFRDPSIQIIPTLGPKACRYCLQWAIWDPWGSGTDVEAGVGDVMARV